MSDKEKPQSAFPGRLPTEMPTDRPLSAASKRLYDMWAAQQDIDNPFYTTFRYSRITGIGKDESDYSVSRRDPSKVLKIGNTYYVWYTRRRTKVHPLGRNNIDEANDVIPVVDWDLADICFATSEDGFNWQEQGIAVPRAPKGSYGDRSLSTPDILAYGGRYYLYYQTFYHDVAGKRLRQRQHGLVGLSGRSLDTAGPASDRTRHSRRMG